MSNAEPRTPGHVRADGHVFQSGCYRSPGAIERLRQSKRDRRAGTKSAAPRAKAVPKGFIVKGATLRMEDGSWVRVEATELAKREPTPEEYVQALREVLTAQPARPMIPVEIAPGQRGTRLAVLSLNDAHFGMLAWGDQTGEGHYDLDIADRDYRNAALDLTLALGARDDIGRVLYVAGSDMMHADGPADNGTGGRTTRGTAVETVADHRVKVFRAALNRTLSTARLAAHYLKAPVDIAVIPGNHDNFMCQTLAVALETAFRIDENITVLPGYMRQRQYYRYFKVGLMLAHGDWRSKRQEDQARLTFADEAGEAWNLTETREILAGHAHATSTTEERGIRLRRLPALAEVDNYAATEGYRHVRAGTALVYSPRRFEALYESGPDE